MKKEEGNTLTAEDGHIIGAFILQMATIFLLFPIVIMFVWNTLLTELVDVATIGYGGAWIVIVIRMFLTNKTSTLVPEFETKEQKAKRMYTIIVTQVIRMMLIGAIAYTIAKAMGI